MDAAATTQDEREFDKICSKISVERIGNISSYIEYGDDLNA